MSPEQHDSLLNSKLSRRNLLKSGGVLLEVAGLGGGLPLTVYSARRAQKIDRGIKNDIAEQMPDAPHFEDVEEARETLFDAKKSIEKKDFENDPNVVQEINDILYSDEVTNAHTVLTQDKKRDALQQELIKKRGSDTWNSRTFYGMISIFTALGHRLWVLK
jgi:hypothetical protein